MDINANQDEWIKASNHQAFTDEVASIVEPLLELMYQKIEKIVGFDALNSNDEDEQETENAFNEIVSEVLFKSLTPLKLRELLDSHNTDR